MAIKLKGKTFLFQMLEKFPDKMGYTLYHLLQNNLGSTSLNEKIRTTYGSYKTLDLILKHLGISIRNKTILEIGSGWLPLMPYYFKYLGDAKEIKTYDLNKHYNPTSIRKLNQIFTKEFGKEIKNIENYYQLPKGIHYFPNTNLIQEEKLAADIIFSRFVLEHVNPKDLEEMHKRFKTSLKPGAFIIHLISPSDHRAYVDNSLSLQDFLKYSAEEWEHLQTKFDYHNRLRLSQYVDIFKNLGFEVAYLNYDNPPKDSESYKKFQNVSLHPDFSDFSEEDLTAGSINMVLKV